MDDAAWAGQYSRITPRGFFRQMFVEHNSFSSHWMQRCLIKQDRPWIAKFLNTCETHWTLFVFFFRRLFKQKHIIVMPFCSFPIDMEKDMRRPKTSDWTTMEDALLTLVWTWIDRNAFWYCYCSHTLVNVFDWIKAGQKGNVSNLEYDREFGNSIGDKVRTCIVHWQEGSVRIDN